MNALGKLGETLNNRMHEVSDYTNTISVESGVITANGGLQVESLDSVIPSSDYEVLSGTVSPGDKVLMVWAEDDPIILGVIGGSGGGDVEDDFFLWVDIPQSAAERATSTDALGNAIYDIGFNDVTV